MNDDTELTEHDKVLLEMATDKLQGIKPGETVKLKDLLDKGYFEATKEDHVYMGRRFSHLVHRDLLPLEPAGKNGENHNLYRVTSKPVTIITPSHDNAPNAKENT